MPKTFVILVRREGRGAGVRQSVPVAGHFFTVADCKTRLSVIYYCNDKPFFIHIPYIKGVFMTDFKAVWNRRQDLVWRIVIAAAVAVTFGRALSSYAGLPGFWPLAGVLEPTAANFRRIFTTPIE